MMEEFPAALTKRFDVKVKKTTKNHKQVRKRSQRKRASGEGFIFSLSGVHGVGKTTVYEYFKRQFEDNPFIKMFPERLRPEPPFPFGSKDKQIAFRAELHYNQQMIERNRLAKSFIQESRENIVILDRSPLSTLIYARALGLPKKDYDLIEDTFKSVTWQKEHVIYLEAEPKTIMKRILQRGSLDTERLKWNEEDYEYLIRVLKKYDEVWTEFNLTKKKGIDRVWTEDKTPEQVVDEVIKIIERRSGINISNQIKIPKGQAKLTNFI